MRARERREHRIDRRRRPGEVEADELDRHDALDALDRRHHFALRDRLPEAALLEGERSRSAAVTAATTVAASYSGSTRTFASTWNVSGSYGSMPDASPGVARVRIAFVRFW